MLRLSKLTDYAVVVMVRLGRGEAVQTSPCIAAATGVPEPTVAKVLKILSAAGLVASHRGARGGYRLVRPLDAVPIADVIAAIDGPLRMTACSEADGSCDQYARCNIRDPLWRIKDRIVEALSTCSIQEMATESLAPSSVPVAPVALIHRPAAPVAGGGRER